MQIQLFWPVCTFMHVLCTIADDKFQNMLTLTLLILNEIIILDSERNNCMAGKNNLPVKVKFEVTRVYLRTKIFEHFNIYDEHFQQMNSFRLIL